MFGLRELGSRRTVATRWGCSSGVPPQRGREIVDPGVFDLLVDRRGVWAMLDGLRPLSPLISPFAPEGPKDNSPRFQPWVRRPSCSQALEGRRRSFAVPLFLILSLCLLPPLLQLAPRHAGVGVFDLLQDRQRASGVLDGLRPLAQLIEEDARNSVESGGSPEPPVYAALACDSGGCGRSFSSAASSFGRSR